MASSRFLNVISVALVAVLALSHGTTPANAVSVLGSQHHAGRSHHDISLKKRTVRSKRSNSGRCKAKTSSSASSTHSSTTTTKKATSTKQADAVQTTKASTSSSKSSSSGSSGSDLRGKACLAWPNSDYLPLSPWNSDNIGLIYSWDENKVPNAASLGMTYAPMLWGYKNADSFKSKVVEGYATYALGMNEPNEEGQSNMDAQSGISLWKEYLLPLKDKGYTLISPAMSSRPNGKDWIAEFMADSEVAASVSGIATHYYGTDLDEFKTYVTYWHTTYNLPVYVTEYADQDFNGGAQADMDEIWAFMSGATSWINDQDWIHAHCWFGAMQDMTNVNTLNQLMNTDGQTPNDLGYYFINN